MDEVFSEPLEGVFGAVGCMLVGAGRRETWDIQRTQRRIRLLGPS
jgi:hypothetical protein